MDLLVCAYPLYLTHQYYSNQSNTENLPFLSVWWSTFGAITLAENYASIDNLPFYWILKSGVMISLYSSDYREWLTKNALSTAATAGEKIKDTAVSIANEHFPKLKEYIKIPNTEKDNHSTQGWFDWFSKKN